MPWSDRSDRPEQPPRNHQRDIRVASNAWTPRGRHRSRRCLACCADALGLKELRYVDESIIEQMEATTAERAERLSRRCVDFLLTPGSLDPYIERIQKAGQQVSSGYYKNFNQN